MNRFILALALAAVPTVAPSIALAQQPTPAQIEKAKAAFGEGKTLFEQGDFMEAAVKFKESYNLSKNAVLLYNIGFANEKAGQDDVALFYYRKFLSDAPADAAQRPEVTERVKELEKKFQTGTTTPTEPTPTEPTHHESEPAKPLKIKPAGTYTEADVQHQLVDTAPPKKPLDITAFVPEDSGFEVTLYYRTAGEGKFTAKPMKWHYKQLIARVPPEKMIGESLQYYIEAKDSTGAVVARKGKSTSPNLVTLEPNAPVRYFPDFTDDTAGSSGSSETPITGRDEDPLHPHNPNDDHSVGVVGPSTPITGGGGITDPSSKKFTYMKWGSTATAVAMLGVSVGFYLRAGSFADALESDCPPNSGCQFTWDSYAQSTYDSGKTSQTISRVTGVIGIGAAVVAGVWWYKSLKGHHAAKESAPKATEPKHDEMAWQVTPVLPASHEGFTGAAASIEF